MRFINLGWGLRGLGGLGLGFRGLGFRVSGLKEFRVWFGRFLSRSFWRRKRLKYKSIEVLQEVQLAVV